MAVKRPCLAGLKLVAFPRVPILGEQVCLALGFSVRRPVVTEHTQGQWHVSRGDMVPSRWKIREPVGLTILTLLPLP